MTKTFRHNVAIYLFPIHVLDLARPYLFLVTLSVQ